MADSVLDVPTEDLPDGLSFVKVMWRLRTTAHSGQENRQCRKRMRTAIPIGNGPVVLLGSYAEDALDEPDLSNDVGLRYLCNVMRIATLRGSGPDFGALIGHISFEDVV